MKTGRWNSASISCLHFACLLLMAGGLAAVPGCARTDKVFRRVEFSLTAPEGEGVKGMALVPVPGARFPAIVYFHDSGGSLAACERVLGRVAELGCTAVAIQYDETSQLHFARQVAALHDYLRSQPWAQGDAIGWIGFGLGGQRSLGLVLGSAGGQPQCYVGLGAGLAEAPAQGGGAATAPPAAAITCPVLLLHGGDDKVCPASDCRNAAELLSARGAPVVTEILPGAPHDFGPDFGVATRAAAEYCAAHLPVADYTVGLVGCTLTQAERDRFNRAMARAGRNRGELWKAVAASREPERRTVMMVVGGLEDYDLAHISAAHLREVVRVAWQARRTYSWCRNTPLDIFERFTAAPRALEEPLGRFQDSFSRRLRQPVKYCRTTAEACDAVAHWRRLRAAWKELPVPEDPTPGEVLASRGGDCRPLVSLFTYLARSVGVAVRPVVTIWPTLGTGHYWVEVWDAETKGWHSFDASTANRTYNCDWVLNVPKAATHATRGERGSWDAAREGRWEAYTNSVSLCYPSGRVLVRVLEGGKPLPNQRVNAEAWLAGRMVAVTGLRTDGRGEVSFVLGQSARRPYRFVLEGNEQPDWEWLAVKAGGEYKLTLNRDHKKGFDAAVAPPPLGFPEWAGPNQGRGR